MQYFDFTLPPNSVFKICGQGAFIRYMSGSAGGSDASIILKCTENSGQVIMYPGQAVRFPADAVGWYIQNNKGQATILGQILIGEGDFWDSTVAGTVSVVDGGKSRTQGGSAFAIGGTQGGVAAKVTSVQLWNPAASQKNAFVEQVTFQVSAADGAGMLFNQAALTTQISAGKSKKSGATDSALSMYKDTLAAYPAGAMLFSCNVPASGTVVFKPAEPICLTPGYGLQVYFSTLANSGGASFEYFEEGV